MWEVSEIHTSNILKIRSIVNRMLFKLSRDEAVEEGKRFLDATGLAMLLENSEGFYYFKEICNKVKNNDSFQTEAGGVVFEFRVSLPDIEINYCDTNEKFDIAFPVGDINVINASNWGIHERLFKNIMNDANSPCMEILLEVCLNSKVYNDIFLLIDQLLWNIFRQREFYGLEDEHDVVSYFIIFVLPEIIRYK